MDRFENIPETALRWHQEGKGAVLATVVETWGSAPRRVGGQLVINRQGEMEDQFRVDVLKAPLF